ncbi:MAG TPA: regulatory protein RecX [Nitrospirota bacterium]|nr:regulatory protein RecX [Nitrospirota bacterium]
MPNEGRDEKELKQARNTAYRFLAIRPRSRAEVEKKLREREFPANTVSAVVEQLLRFGYLDDPKFARQWAAARVRTRGFGRRRIELELRQKGIGRDTAHEALAEAFDDSSESEIARREAEKKLRTLARFTPDVRKRRLAGFLGRKGFSGEVVREMLRMVPRQETA